MLPRSTSTRPGRGHGHWVMINPENAALVRLVAAYNQTRSESLSVT